MLEGMAAYRRGAYTRAFALWQPLAERGVAQAEFQIAMLFLDGRIGPADPVAARRWATRALDHGYGPARDLLATIDRKVRPSLPLPPSVASSDPRRRAVRGGPPPPCRSRALRPSLPG
jgi:TPR repeat protein